MNKRRRDYIALCLREGVKLLRIEDHKRHCRLVFEAGFVVAASTPSDRRNLLNVRSQVRRLHRCAEGLS